MLKFDRISIYISFTFILFFMIFIFLIYIAT
jgi:hypothetical protein